MNKKILDVACGSRMFWFNKNNSDALFCDIRKENHILCDGRTLEINPDVICDFTNLPFENDSFNLVVFDPPHLNQIGENAYMAKKYGVLKDDWKTSIKSGFSECFRVLKDDGVLIFKWSEYQIPLKEILMLTEQKPLFGHKSGKHSQTHWVCFMKNKSESEEAK